MAYRVLKESTKKMINIVGDFKGEFDIENTPKEMYRS
tara:strand:+ start:17125 stop:17235 length:111 start_codon:yes stop_codon:yes gene_type:complete